MAFTSPISVGYGIGQIGAGIGQGLVRGMQEAPVLQRENLQNQQLGMEVQGQQAANSALSQAAPGEVAQEQQLTPYDNQLQRMNAAATQLEQQGQGLQAQHLRQQAVGLAQQQHSFSVGRAAQALLGPDPNSAIPYIKAAGFGSPQKIDVDANGNFEITGADGHVNQLSRFQVAQMAADPDKVAQTMMMSAYYTGRLGNQSRGLDIKENQNQVGNLLRQLSINQRDQASQRALQARLGAANISANTRKFIFNNAPAQQAFLHMTTPPEQGGLGLSEDQALGAIDQAHMAGANASVQQQQILRDYLKQNPGATLQQGLDYIGNQNAAPAPTPKGRIARKTTPAVKQIGPPKVATQADYDALQPGTVYIDPNGVQRTKGQK